MLALDRSAEVKSKQGSLAGCKPNVYGAFVPTQADFTARSGCPVCVSLERFGDRWSLLIIRDMMVRGYRTFWEFLRAGEGISTNVLANRLRKLETARIIIAEQPA